MLAILAIMFEPVPARAVFFTMHNFFGAPADGSEPFGTTVADPTTGNLYGTTSTGGTHGLGVVYCINPNFGVTILHNFGGPDGAKPTCTLILIPSRDAAGAAELYGTTLLGGVPGKGVVFKIMVTGAGYTKIHQFVGGPKDGANPFAGVIQASDGRLYGTTLLGGVSGLGTTYRLTTAGAGFLVTHSFWGNIAGAAPDGANPYARLFESNKMLYGTTCNGGKLDEGTVFSEGFAGAPYAVIHTFTNTPDGAHPCSEVIEQLAVSGAPMLWGTAKDGGALNDGMIYSVGPGGAPYSDEYDFTGGLDGANPFGALIADGAPAMVFGTTLNGGPTGNGVIYMANPNVPAPIPEAVVYGFLPGDGEHPYSALMLPVPGGNLVGTTRDGGFGFDGTLFEQTP
jgi:uncharacterized repeat protein (TIGR03803 family)